MMDRREFVLGAACVASAASAAALRPRHHLRLMGGASLEAITPKSFGAWSISDFGQVLQPPRQGTLAAKLYSQTLARIYTDAGSRSSIMLSIAYGDTQSDLLQLHRPESCYPAFGFALSDFRRVDVPLPGGLAIPGRTLIATAPNRVENVTYWTRIGEYLPTSPSEQRADKLRSAIAGFIPDGMLVRCSNIGESRIGFEVNQRFLADLVLALAPEHRPAFIGTDLTREITA